MDGLLETYIERTTTPENTQLLFKSIDLLDQSGMLSHVEHLENWVIAITEGDIEIDLDLIFTHLRESLLTFLRSQGIRLEQGVPHQLINDVMEAVLTINRFGDPQYLLAVFDHEYDNDAICIALLSRANNIGWSRLSPWFQGCDHASIEQFKTRLQDRLDSLPEPTVELSAYRQRILYYTTEQGRQPAFEFVQQGARLHSPIERLIGQFHDTLQIASDRPLTFAEKALGLLLLSDQSMSDFDAVFKRLLDDYIADINLVTIAYRRFTALMAQLPQH
jgi:hypothetical protein